VIPRGIQRIVGLRADGMKVSIPLQTVNNKSRASTACDIALVPFTDRKLIAARVVQGGFAAIAQIMVHAVGNGETWRMMAAHAGYTIEVEEGQII
jgi:hypothetical protein